MTSVECHKRDRLLGEYNDAVLGAFVASQALSKIADTTVLSDYRALIGRQGIAGAKASKARLVDHFRSKNMEFAVPTVEIYGGGHSESISSQGAGAVAFLVNLQSFFSSLAIHPRRGVAGREMGGGKRASEVRFPPRNKWAIRCPQVVG
jgi:hypothetical protein